VGIGMAEEAEVTQQSLREVEKFIKSFLAVSGSNKNPFKG
jgi:hypothetical protein